jgi:4-hydroxyacetophenone monooxygenase
MDGAFVFAGAVEPITVGDDDLRCYLEQAAVPPLLPSLAYATGDLSLLRDDLRPDPLLTRLPQGGLSPEQQAEARELAFEALVRFRDGGCRLAPEPSDEMLLQILEFTVGESKMAPYLPVLKEELAARGEDLRAPAWHIDDLAPGREVTVAVIGAGMSGILAAHRLNQAGLRFVVFEKNAEVGGTWCENSYPGCRVDNPSHNYSYAFAQRHDWPFHFSPQPVLLDYFRQCARSFGVHEHIRFHTEVLSATWSDDDLNWTLHVRGPDGDAHIAFDAVISGVGQLNRPNYPAIEGRDDFAGPSFHSARWDHSVDLTGKRVAVIGTGASAMQFIPEIAPHVEQLLVFQRTPAWIGPTPDYHDPVEPELQWLYRHVPSYAEFNRFWMFWQTGDAGLEAARVDPSWSGGTATVSAANDFLREVLVGYIQSQFADRPDLLEHVVPGYPPGAKRMIRDNGVWARALSRDNVELVTTGIERITSTGIVTTDGRAHDVDVIVYGTGFQASKFLTPMQVRGRTGIDLHEKWAGDARAYLGVTVPGFPNLFCLYGPNTNIVVNGSIIYFSECGVRYILGCFEHLLRNDRSALDVRKDVHDEFNEQVDAANRAMAWGWSEVNSWYKNDFGRVTQNWPFSLLEYWQRTLRPDPDDYELLG